MKASDILGLKDCRTKQVEVPQWGKTLTIREMGLGDGMKFVSMLRESDGKTIELTGEDIAGVVARGVVDDSGERVFSDAEIPALARKNKVALMLLYTEIINLSGDTEEAAKN